MRRSPRAAVPRSRSRDRARGARRGRCRRPARATTGTRRRRRARAARPASSRALEKDRAIVLGANAPAFLLQDRDERPVRAQKDLDDVVSGQLVAPRRTDEHHLLVVGEDVGKEHEEATVDEDRTLGDAPDEVPAPVVFVEEAASRRREAVARATVARTNSAKTKPAGRRTSGGASSTMKRGGDAACDAAAPRPSDPGSAKVQRNESAATATNAIALRRVRTASTVKIAMSARPSA